VAIPAGVTVSVSGSVVAVKGPKGELSYTHLPLIKVEVKDNEVIIDRTLESKQARERHGLTRALVQNMVDGVTKGYEKRLEVIGVGFKAQVKGQTLQLALGFSHPVEFAIPKGVTITQDEKNKNLLILSGIDRQLVGQTASDIRALKPPEPYKGKGIRYSDEFIRRKVGKAATAKAA
jgi:large subunit ribosomal protein L6